MCVLIFPFSSLRVRHHAQLTSGICASLGGTLPHPPLPTHAVVSLRSEVWLIKFSLHSKFSQGLYEDSSLAACCLTPASQGVPSTQISHDPAVSSITRSPGPSPNTGADELRSGTLGTSAGMASRIAVVFMIIFRRNKSHK